MTGQEARAKIVSIVQSYIGCNESGSRMIRRQVPKGTGFTAITEDDALRVQRWVNEYPRGILDGRCAARVLLELGRDRRD